MLQDKQHHGHNSEQKTVKKSLAEKISRTLDKIASVTTVSERGERGGRGRGGVQAGQHSNVVWPVYAGYSPGYRTVRGPHGMSYQYVMTGWPDPGLYHHEYHGHSAGHTSGHYYPTNTFCRCPHSGSESVRTKSGVSKCKKCSKPRTPLIRSGAGSVSGDKGKPRARLLHDTFHSSPASVTRANTTRVPNQKPASGPKDPYDYIRRTRLKADDWDTYWDNSDVSETQPSSNKQSRNSDNKSSRHSKSPSEPRRVVSQFDPRTLNNHGSSKSSSSKHDPRLLENNNNNSSDKGRQNLDIRMTTCDLMEDEDSPQPESKPISNAAPSVNSLNSDSQGQLDCILSSAKDSTPNLHGDKSVQSDDDHTTLNQTESGLSSSLLADMATMQSKISVAEMRYRKFQRRNPLRKLSLQIDEVIIEEDEEALENEELNHSSLNSGSLPPLFEEEKQSSSSDDEFGIGKFKHVIGDSNFADEILSEIYGATPGSPRLHRRKENPGESLAEEDVEEEEENAGNMLNRSLADEILDEIYGTTEEREVAESPEYCNIDELNPSDKSDDIHGEQEDNPEQVCAENLNVAGEYTEHVIIDHHDDTIMLIHLGYIHLDTENTLARTTTGPTIK